LIVGVDGTFSRWLPVLSRVPQGSVLGPIFFVCCINDMPDSISSIIYMYADDTKVFRHLAENIDHLRLQSDHDLLVEWPTNGNLDLMLINAK
jgi:ribonucleases P/MRP protein subunit RPP40